MDRRRILKNFVSPIALVAMVAGIAIGAGPPISWLDAGHLPPDRPARPKPIEVDKPNNGPLRGDLIPMPSPSPDPMPMPSPPRVYELVDVSGKRWTGTDWPSLWGWVQSCNASMQAQPPPILQTRIYRGTTQCVNGACPTR